MKNIDLETIGSTICGVILFVLGIIGTFIGVLTIYAPFRSFLGATEFRLDMMICGPLLMLLSSTLLKDLKGDDKKGKEGIR